MRFQSAYVRTLIGHAANTVASRLPTHPSKYATPTATYHTGYQMAGVTGVTGLGGL